MVLMWQREKLQGNQNFLSHCIFFCVGFCEHQSILSALSWSSVGVCLSSLPAFRDHERRGWNLFWFTHKGLFGARLCPMRSSNRVRPSVSASDGTIWEEKVASYETWGLFLNTCPESSGCSTRSPETQRAHACIQEALPPPTSFQYKHRPCKNTPGARDWAG